MGCDRCLELEGQRNAALAELDKVRGWLADRTEALGAMEQERDILLQEREHLASA